MIHGIKELFEEIFPSSMITVLQQCYGDYIKDKVSVKVSQSYEYVDVSFSKLKKISEKLGCNEIDINKDKWPGCETCDHGSSYEVTFECYDFKD